MAIPIVIILAVILWVLISSFKYWYFSKMQIKYTHEIDDKLLEQLRRPPQHVIDKFNKLKRDPKFTDEPKANFSSSKLHTTNNKPNDKDEQNSGKAKQRRLTIFEEVEQMQKKGKMKRNPHIYDRSIFEDSLTKLYKDIAEEKAKIKPSVEKK